MASALGATHKDFHHANLSNIFEYMNEADFRKVSAEFARLLLPHAKIAYWNLMVPRRMSAVAPEQFVYKQALSEHLSRYDKGFFYKRFIIDQKQ